MKQLFIDWLRSRGIALGNEASETSVLQAVQKAVTEASAPGEALANEKTTLDGQITALTNDATVAQGRITALTNERDTLKSTALAERNGRATAIVDLAITRGKLAVADRAAQITSLANSADEPAFKTASEKLLTQARAGLRTIARDLGKADGKALANDMDDAGVFNTYVDALKKHMTENPGCDPVDAASKVKSAHPALAEALAARRPKA